MTLSAKEPNQDPSKCRKKSLDNKFQRRMHSGRMLTGTDWTDRVPGGVQHGGGYSPRGYGPRRYVPWKGKYGSWGIVWRRYGPCRTIKDMHSGWCVMRKFIPKGIHQTHTHSWSLVNRRVLSLRWVLYKRLMHINEMDRWPRPSEQPWWSWLKFSISNVIPWQFWGEGGTVFGSTDLSGYSIGGMVLEGYGNRGYGPKG